MSPLEFVILAVSILVVGIIGIVRSGVLIPSTIRGRSIPYPAAVESARVSLAPDCRRVVLQACARRLVAWVPFEQGQEFTLASGSQAIGSQMKWSPEGRFLVTCGWNQPTDCFDTQTGRRIWSRGADSSIAGASWSPDGTELACLDAEKGWVTLRDAHTGEALRTFERCLGSSAEWAPAGLRVATNGVIFDAGTGELVSRFTADDDPIAWSPDGRYLALGSGTGPWEAGWVAVVEAETGATVWRHKDRSRRVQAAFWSPDGKYVLMDFSRDRFSHLRVYEALTGRWVYRLVGPRLPIQSAGWVPGEDRCVAVSAYDGAVEFWEWDVSALGEAG